MSLSENRNPTRTCKKKNSLERKVQQAGLAVALSTIRSRNIARTLVLKSTCLYFSSIVDEKKSGLSSFG